MHRYRKVLYRSSVVALIVFVLSIFFNPLAASAATLYPVEVILYTGDTAVDATNFEADLKAALAKKGADPAEIKYTNALTTAFSVTDSFAWTPFDHTGNWREADYPNGDQSPTGGKDNKHIIIKNNGKNITFYGYGKPSYKDFMLMSNDVESTKTFTFDLDEAGIKYHSMEGGGFLFNSKIDQGLLSGYAILFDQNGMELFEISGVDAEKFHNEENAKMSQVNGIKLLKNFGKPSSKTHKIKIEVTPEKIDLWDNSVQTIIGWELPKKYGNGFGPIASHNPHDCSELSYFTFNNLQMSMTLTLSLQDVLNKAQWSGCNRYVVNLADKVAPELSNKDNLALIVNKMSKDNLYYVGWGTSANKDQAADVIKQNQNKGKFVDNSNYANSVEEIATYIVDKLKTDVAGIKAIITPGFAGGDSAQSVTKNVTLPTSDPNCPTVKVSWSSDNQAISNSGVVTRSDNGDQTVNLTATFSKGGITETKTIQLVVKKRVLLVKTGSILNFWTLSIIGLVCIGFGIGTVRKQRLNQ